jgi:hypothetical protein
MTSPPKRPQFFTPSDEKSIVVLVGLRSQITPTVWRPPRGKTHDHVRQPSEGGVPDRFKRPTFVEVT